MATTLARGADREYPGRRACTHSALAAAGVLWSVLSHAQMYVMNPAMLNANMNVYFGSTKDADGHLLSDVTVSLETDTTTYVMVTDEAGRFKIEVPKDLLPSQIKFSCSKPGYTLLRTTTRPPPNKAVSPLQADCVLNLKNSPHQ